MTNFSKQMAWLAAGLLAACSAHPDAGENDEALSDTAETVEKAVCLAGIGGAADCPSNCETKEVCENEFRPCNPPILVGGRNIDCIVLVCRQKRVCDRGGEGILSELDAPVVDVETGPLGPLGPLGPVDPLPLPF